MPRVPKPRPAAEALDRAGAAIDAAEVALERSAEMLLHRYLARTERPSIEIDPVTEAILRDCLVRY